MPSCVALALGFVAGSAQGAPKVPSVDKSKVINLEVDLAGYLEIRRLHDTAVDCSPGRRYIQTNTYRFETVKFVKIELHSVPVGGLPVITSKRVSPAGSAKTTGVISDYKTTNWCPPTAPAPEPPAPACSTLSGKLLIGLTPGEVPDLTGDEPVGLLGVPMLISGPRTGSPAGFIAPTGVGSIKLFNLAKGKRIRRSVVVQGPCSKVDVKAHPGSGPIPEKGGLNADGDCRMTGKIVFTIRRAK